jgi:putative ABC transport system permease protein
MSVFSLIVRELWFRKGNALLSVIGLTAAVAVFVGFRTTSEASRKETIRITRDIGFNLRIIPRETDMVAFWNHGFSDRTMDQSAVDRLAGYEKVFMTYNHLTPSLQGEYSIGDGLQVIVSGEGDTIAGKGKKPMGFRIKPGTVHLGYQVAAKLGVSKGQSIELGGNTYQVAETLIEAGTDEDIRIYTSLEDAQAILDKPGRINEIRAIDCLCLTSDQDPLSILRDELKKALPEAEVLQMKSIADARARQRQMMDNYMAMATPAILLVCGAWLGTLAMLNVRERKSEIGIYRALGKGSGSIAGLILGKAVILGVIAGVLGFGLGQWVALHFGPKIFTQTAKSIQPDFSLLWMALITAPLFSAIAAFIPASLAVRQDPVENLRIG